MEEINNTTEQPAKPTGKIFKDNIMMLASMLGGPLAAGYIIAHNFKVFGDVENEKRAKIFTGALVIVLLVVVYFLQGVEKFQPLLIPLCYSVLANSYMKATQRKRIDEHIKAGGETESVGTLILVIVGGLVAFTAILFAFVLAIID